MTLPSFVPKAQREELTRNTPGFLYPPGLILPVLLLSFALGLNAQESPDDLTQRLVKAAVDQAGITVSYDGSYRRIAYPGGDVSESTGVCCDVIVRAYRKIGIDLQVRVHEDMLGHFKEYPQKWGLSAPDSNIDHRRVPNLQTFFRRAGVELPVSQDAPDYRPGDLVTWMLPGNLPHIGMITFRKDDGTGNRLVVHNIGRGVQIEDILFEFPITGHYRYAMPVFSKVLPE